MSSPIHSHPTTPEQTEGDVEVEQLVVGSFADDPQALLPPAADFSHEHDGQTHAAHTSSNQWLNEVSRRVPFPDCALAVLLVVSLARMAGRANSLCTRLNIAHWPPRTEFTTTDTNSSTSRRSKGPYAAVLAKVCFCFRGCVRVRDCSCVGGDVHIHTHDCRCTPALPPPTSSPTVPPHHSSPVDVVAPLFVPPELQTRPSRLYARTNCACVMSCVVCCTPLMPGAGVPVIAVGDPRAGRCIRLCVNKLARLPFHFSALCKVLSVEVGSMATVEGLLVCVC